MSNNVDPLIRYAFYAFVAAIPFETASLELASTVGSLSQVMGLMLLGAALLQPRICFNRPPGAFWCFGGYVLAYLVLGTTQDPKYLSPMFVRFFTLIQMLFLLWIAYNLFKHPEICRGALLALAGSCIVVAVLQISGTATVEITQGRSSVFADNPNTVAATLSLGLLALAGLAHGRMTVNSRMPLLEWTGIAVIGIAIVMTGSRGPILGLLLGLTFLIMKGGGPATRFKLGLVALLAIGFLAWVSYENEAMRIRWERTLVEGSLAKREDILPAAWSMFLQKPLLGWGPFLHTAELGSRFGKPYKEPHNLYLWVLNETGLLGGIPFLAGLWLSLHAAWKARSGSEGSLPLAMLACLLTTSMALTGHNRKLFWLVLAYTLATAPYKTYLSPVNQRLAI